MSLVSSRLRVVCVRKEISRRILHFQPVDVLHGRNQDGRFRRLAQRSDHFIVAGMADQHDGVVLARELHRFQMNLGDQRAGGVDHLQLALLGLLPHGRRNTMRAEDDARALRHLAQFFDKNRAGLPQFIHYVPVVDDFFTHIYRRAVKVQSDLHHVDGAHHSGAKSPRPEKDDLFHGTTVANSPMGLIITAKWRVTGGYDLLITATRKLVGALLSLNT